MNAGEVVRRGSDVVCGLDLEKAEKGKDFEETEMYAKLGWICEFRDDLKDWRSLVEIVEGANAFVDFVGLYRGVHEDLDDYLSKLPTSLRFPYIKEELAEFEREQQEKQGLVSKFGSLDSGPTLHVPVKKFPETTESSYFIDTRATYRSARNDDRREDSPLKWPMLRPNQKTESNFILTNMPQKLLQRASEDEGSMWQRFWRQAGLRGATYEEHLQSAKSEKRVIFTQDDDFIRPVNQSFQRKAWASASSQPAPHFNCPN